MTFEVQPHVAIQNSDSEISTLLPAKGILSAPHLSPHCDWQPAHSQIQTPGRMPSAYEW